MKGQISSDHKLLTGLFFRLLPFQVLLIVISAVNGIVDSLYASNMIGKEAMSAIGLFGPLNHFLYAMTIMFVSGSQMLYGRYLAKDREKISGLFTVNIVPSRTARPWFCRRTATWCRKPTATRRTTS